MTKESKSFPILTWNRFRHSLVEEKQAVVVERSQQDAVDGSPPYCRRACTLETIILSIETFQWHNISSSYFVESEHRLDNEQLLLDQAKYQSVVTCLILHCFEEAIDCTFVCSRW